MNACDHDFEEVSELGDRGKSYECVLCSYTYRDDQYQEPAGFINHFGVPIAEYNLKYYQPKQKLCYMDWILTEEEVDVLKMLVRSKDLVDRMGGLEVCQSILDNAPQGSYAYDVSNGSYLHSKYKDVYVNDWHQELQPIRVAVEHVNKILSYKVN